MEPEERAPTQEEIDQVLKAFALSAKEMEIPAEQWECRERVAVREMYSLSELFPAGVKATAEQQDAVQKVIAESKIIYPKPDLPAWQLRSDPRRDTLRRLAEQGRLRETLQKNPSSFSSVFQDLLSAYILSAAPAIADQNLDQLESTLQIVDWLDGCGLDLPAPMDVRRRLAHERLVKPFRFLVGSHFHGRENELADLLDYVNGPGPSQNGLDFSITSPSSSLESAPPILVYGPGGIGKSTLIARFILEYAEREGAERFPYVYIDFNRLDIINIRNPVSILLESARQIAIQYPQNETRWVKLQKEWRKRSEEFDLQGDVEFTQSDQSLSFGLEASASFSRREWDRFFYEYLDALASLLIGSQPLLLVLDTMEELLHHNPEYLDELWAFLTAMKERIPVLRIVLSGRSPLPKQFTVRAMPLAEISLEAAIGLLHDRGIADEAFARQVIEITGCSPLSLWLAAELYQLMKGDCGAFDNLETRQEYFYQVKEYLIQGVLYRRILGHIDNRDPRVRPLAHPGMVLRRITPDLILNVLAGPCKIEVKDISDAQELFKRLKAEVALVEIDPDNANVIRQRPELRQAMLELLLQDDPKTVRDIHTAAQAYFQQQIAAKNPPDPADQADETYHHLSLVEDPTSLDEVQKPELEKMAGLLGNAIDDLPVKMQAYLVSRVSNVRVQVQIDESVLQVTDLTTWELLTARSVQNLLNLGRFEEALKQMETRKERTPGSPLYPLQISALVILGKYDLACQALEEGIRRTPPNSRELHDLLLLSASVDEKQTRLADALRSYQRALAIARKLADAVACLRDQLSILRLTQALFPTNAPEIQAENKELVSAWDQVADAELLKNPSLVRLVAAQQGGQVEVIRRAIKLVGLGAASPANLDNLASSLYDWDETRSLELKEPFGVLARQEGVTVLADNFKTWQNYLQQTPWNEATGVLMKLIEGHPLSIPMAISLADLLKARLLLTRQQANQLQHILLSAFTQEELDALLLEQFGPLTNTLGRTAIPTTQAALLVNWAETNGALAQLLQALITERPNEPELAALLLSLGIDYRPAQTFADPEQAAAYYRQLAETAHARGDSWAEGSALSELGGIYAGRREWTHAVDAYMKVVQVQTGFFGSNHPSVAGAFAHLGEALLNIPNYGEAELAFNEAIRIIETAFGPEHRNLAAIANSQGLARYGKGKAREAIPCYERALAVARREKDFAVIGSALVNLGNAYFFLGQIQQAAEKYKQRLELARERNDRQGEMRVLDRLGQVERQTGDLQHARKFFEQALALAQELKDRVQETQTVNSLGVLHSDMGNIAEAIQMYKQSLAIAREIGDRGNEATLNTNLGAAYRQMGDLARAEEYLQEGLKELQALGDRDGESLALNNLGLLHTSMGNLDQASTCYEQGLAIARETGNRRLEGNLLGNLGLVNEQKGQYAQAREYYQQQIAIATKIKDTRSRLNACSNLANVLYLAHRYIQSTRYFQQALGLARDLGDHIQEANALYGTGLCALEQAELDQAIKALREALSIYVSLGDPKKEQVQQFLDRAIKEKQVSNTTRVDTGGGAYIQGNDNIFVGDIVHGAQVVINVRGDEFSQQGDLKKVAPAVCLIEVADEKGIPSFRSTGFLIGPDLLMTSYHAIAPLLDGELPTTNLAIRFDLLASQDRGTLSQGQVYTLASGREAHQRYGKELPWRIALDPELDYALLRLARPAGEESSGGSRRSARRGWLLLQQKFSLKKGDPLGIIYYGQGLRQVSLFQENAYLGRTPSDRQLRYQINTEPGSSGAPVLNAALTVVAIHNGRGSLGKSESSSQFGSAIDLVLDSIHDQDLDVFVEILKLQQ